MVLLVALWSIWVMCGPADRWCHTFSSFNDEFCSADPVGALLSRWVGSYHTQGSALPHPPDKVIDLGSLLVIGSCFWDTRNSAESQDSSLKPLWSHATRWVRNLTWSSKMILCECFSFLWKCWLTLMTLTLNESRINSYGTNKLTGGCNRGVSDRRQWSRVKLSASWLSITGP